MKSFKILSLLFINLLITTTNPMKQPKFKTEPSQLTSEEIIKKALEKKSNELPTFEGLSLSLESYAEVYSRIEAEFDLLKKVFPTYEVAGNLSYTMSLDGIIKALKTRFQHMYKKGSIITHKEFEKHNKDKWFLDRPTQDLTRIWGAEYLKKKFIESKSKILKVPKYIIAVDDLDKIQVKINFDTCWPIVLEIVNGIIYREKIAGIPAQMQIGFGYTDYALGNIFKTKEGSYYFLDTEYKSFYDGRPELNMPAWSKNKCEYLKTRFDIVNGINTNKSKIIEFSLTSE